MIKLGVNEALQYLENILNVAHEGIIFVNHEGTILKANPAFTKIMSYEEKEILGKPFYILTSKNQAKQETTSHVPLYRFYSAEKSNMEYIFYNKQGHEVPIRFRSVIIRDKQRQVKEAIGVLEHIVELSIDKEGESIAVKIWEAQQNFKNVLENSVDAILICDNSGHIMMANKAFLQMLNYRQEEVIGKFIVDFTAFSEGTYITTIGEHLIIDQDSVKMTGLKSSELFEKGYIKNWETYFVTKDKVHLPV